MTQAQVRTSTRVIEAYGEFPAGTSDPEIEIVDLTAEQASQMTQPGLKTYSLAGVLTVTPPDPLITSFDPRENEEERAAAQHLAATDPDMATILKATGVI